MLEPCRSYITHIVWWSSKANSTQHVLKLTGESDIELEQCSLASVKVVEMNMFHVFVMQRSIPLVELGGARRLIQVSKLRGQSDKYIVNHVRIS